MKLALIATSAAVLALSGGAAFAQSTSAQPAGAGQDVTQPATGATTGAGAASTGAATDDQTQTPAGSGAAAGDVTASGSAPSTSTTTDTTTGTTTTATTTTAASSAGTYGQAASFTNMTTTNGPVPDTAENRAKYGRPMSNAGKRSAAKGN